MYRIPTRGLFLTSTESLFLPSTHIHLITTSRAHIIYKKRYTLTWNGSPFFKLANPHPTWLFARSQLPFKPLALHCPHARFPAKRTFIYTQTTLHTRFSLLETQIYSSIAPEGASMASGYVYCARHNFSYTRGWRQMVFYCHMIYSPETDGHSKIWLMITIIKGTTNWCT